MKRYLLFMLVGLMAVLTGCDTTSESSISESTTITYLSMYSPFDDEVQDYTFTIDTVNNLIYNVDSLDYGTRVDSLAPMLTPVFNTCKMDGGEINLYGYDTVYVDFTKEHTLTVTTKDDALTKTYKIWVNVHQVDPDSLQWSYQGGLQDDNITADKCVGTEDGYLYWLLNKGGELEVLESFNGGQWTPYTTEGITRAADALDIEHAVAHNNGICVMAGMKLYSSSNGSSWECQETTSDVGLRHLLFSLRGNLYALGEENKILRLNGTTWTESAQMPTGFPVRGESICTGKSPAGTWQATVGCGIDEMGNYLCDFWATENGSYWVQLSLKDSLITPRAYAGMAQYGSGIILMGGEDQNGDMTEDNSLFSQDYGMTWQPLDSAFSINTAVNYLMARRTKQSMVPTVDGHLILIGGHYFNLKTEAIPSREKSYKCNDMWKGMNYGSLPGFKR